MPMKMVAGKSPEWLPHGFTEKFKFKNGRKIKYYINDATGAKYHSKNDVIISCSTTENVDKELSCNNTVDVILAETNDSLDPLPSGWTVEEKTPNGAREGSTNYKIYTELSSGVRFYSRVAVDQYLNSAHGASTTVVQNKIENVDEPLPDKRPQLSITNADSLSKKKKKVSSFKPVTCVSSPADGLPPSWTKDMIISKSGSKTRRDQYYTDPNSGYVFLSKPDALRFLKNGDIRYCVSRPKRIADLQFIKNEIHSSHPDNMNASENLQTTAQLFPVEEINDGEQISPSKVQADSNDNVSDDAKDTFAGTNSLEGQKSKNAIGENSKNAVEENNSGEANGANDVITDPSTEQNLPESEIERQTPKTQLVWGARKSNKRKTKSSLLSRDSKRLGKCESKLSHMVLNEIERQTPKTQLVWGARKSNKRKAKSSLLSWDLKRLGTCEYKIWPGPVLNEHALNATSRDSTGGEVENPLAVEDQSSQEEEQKQTDEGNKSQLCYELEGMWSDDPCIDFAVRTLAGELSVDDIYRGYYETHTNPPPPQANIPNNFQSEFVPHSDSSKAVNTSLFSERENLGFAQFSAFDSQSSITGAANFGGLSSQNSSTEPINFNGIKSEGSSAWAAGNKGRQIKFNP